MKFKITEGTSLLLTLIIMIGGTLFINVIVGAIL
tara:strand:- start:316 stop:417 length:102 start_codon:yes stop_codon:yes gene_type:complete